LQALSVGLFNIAPFWYQAQVVTKYPGGILTRPRYGIVTETPTNIVWDATAAVMPNQRSTGDVSGRFRIKNYCSGQPLAIIVAES
jgi:hypothetical protein